MPSPDGSTPLELAAAKLASSGLTLEDAKFLGMRALTSKQTKQLHASFFSYPALQIPYFDPRGAASKFYRIRYLGELNGFDALRKRSPRYVQPPDTTAEVYFPRGVEWDELLKDPTRGLFITEGELKAACAAKRGYPCLGLGGVWSWKSTKKGQALIPALRAIAWRDRPVYLVFDSDFATKPQVMMALLAFARELTVEGARPHVVTLPAPDDAGKTGLDDFLVARGKDELDALVRSAAPFSSARELWALNEEVLYVRDPGLIVVLADGRKLAPKAFRDHAYSNRHYVETTVNAKGETKSVKKALAPAWLEWEARAEASRITYEPGAPRLTDGGAYNYWPGWGCEPKRGDVTPWTELLDFVFAGDPDARRWFERWCAYPLQHPGAKLYTAAVIWGTVHGTGKSLIGYTLGKIYGRNFSEIEDEDLRGSFNEWAQHKQFVLADEVTGAEHKRDLMERLKKLITRETIRINAKFLPTYEISDCLNYYFTSNHPDAFILEDTDRRYFVHEAPREPLADAFYARYDAWYKRPRDGGPGPGIPALFDHLLRLDLGDFNPNARAPATLAKAAMIRDTKSDVGAWVARLREAPDAVLKLGEVAVVADLMSNEQLLSLYDPAGTKRVTANGLGRELKRAGFEQALGGRTVGTARGPLRLYVLRNAPRWKRADAHELAAHWNAAFGASAAERTRSKKAKY